MINRFYKDQKYIGIKNQQRDTFGNWIDIPNAEIFQGRPYNRYEYDQIILHSAEAWENIKSKIKKIAEAHNMDLYLYQDKLASASPRWIHTIKPNGNETGTLVPIT